MGSAATRAALWVFCGVAGVMLLAPILIVVPLALSESPFLQFPPPGFSLQWFTEFLDDETWIDSVVLSLKVGLGAVVLSLLVGVPAAYALVRGRSPLAWLIEPVLLLPLAVPIIVYAVGAYLIALPLNWIGSLWILIAAHAIIALPYVIVNVSAALRTTDHRLELVAQSLGASPLVAFWKVTLPLIAPAVWASALITLVLSADEAVASLFLAADESPTLPVKLYSSVLYELNPLVPVAATLVVLGTLTVGVVYLVTSRLMTRRWRGAKET